MCIPEYSMAQFNFTNVKKKLNAQAVLEQEFVVHVKEISKLLAQFVKGTRNVSHVVEQANIHARIVKAMVYAQSVMMVGIPVSGVMAVVLLHVQTVVGLVTSLMKLATNVAEVAISVIKNAAYAMVREDLLGNAGNVMAREISIVIIAMVKEAGLVKNVMAPESVLIVMAKDVINVRLAMVQVSVASVKAKGKYGVQIATVREYALSVKERKK